MEALLLPIALACLVWGLVYFRRTGLWGILIGGIIAGTVFGYNFLHVSVVSLDRAVLAISVGLYVVYRVWGYAQPKAWNAGDSMFAGFLGAMVLTTLIHPLSGGASLSKLLFFFLVPATAYWVARNLPLNQVTLRWMYIAFAILGVYLSVTSVAEKTEMYWAVFPKYIADPNFTEFFGRGRGPLLNPSGNGVLLTVTLSCALVLPAIERGWTRWMWVSTWPIYMLGIACTMTRCVWMGGAVAMLGILTALCPSRWRVPLLVFAVGIGSMGVIAKSQSLVGFKRDKNVSVEDMKQSAQLRPLLAMIAWKMFQEHPWTGVGTAGYLDNAKYYIQRDVDMPLEKARPYVQHNIVLGLLVENGLLGTIPFCAMLAIWSWWGWKVWRTESIAFEMRLLGLVFLGMMAGFWANGMFQDVLIITMINTYLFFWGGCIRNAASQLQPQSRWAMPAPNDLRGRSSGVAATA